MSRRVGRYGPLRCCRIDPMPIFIGSDTFSTPWPGPSRPSSSGSPGSRREDGSARDARRHNTTWFQRATFACGALFLFGATASADEFSPERIRTGAAIYSRNCSPCHGSRMQNPESAFDLNKFPPTSTSASFPRLRAARTRCRHGATCSVPRMSRRCGLM
jgi:hypothetical protein